LRKNRLKLGLAIGVAAVVPFVVSCATRRVVTAPPAADPPAVTPIGAAGAADEMAPGEGGNRTPAALKRKLAAAAKAAPSVPTEALDDPESFAEQDWLEHSMDGAGNGPPPFSAFATARNDWFGLLGRPARGTGKWDPHGPTNGLNDLTNLFRDRTVYNTGTENFGGRSVHAVISPACQPEPGECSMWIAASNGGVWRTDNALAVDDPATSEYEGPAWEFVSGQFEQQNTSSLELDPNDPNHKTIWAGTGEPNACSSGCEVGVGLYVSKDGRKGWRGPLGAEHFFGRGIGSIQVKRGDSKTIFVATGRSTRGISNNCCGGADALIPGAPHFGVWRSRDEGKSWQLVNQGANALCTASTPDAVSLNETACSPRGARRVMFDPVDPNTVYASFFARGIWRSRANGDPGTWEQIMLPRGFVGLGGPTTERDEFDVVALPSGETRMYVGAGGGNYTGTGANAARLRRNDAVRNTPAATAQAAWVDFTTYSFAYCEPQCSYDNYVYAPANPENAPNAGDPVGVPAGIPLHDVVYLSGSNQYNENNTGSGRSNGRAVLLSTDGGATFTDMTEDNRSSSHPGALHPDHHALVVNPNNWGQFFDIGDGGINRSDGVFVNDAADCVTPPHSFVIPARIAFCNVVLSRIPQTLTAINRGLRTLATYTLDYDRNNLERISAGTQDNGSWETMGDRETWLNVNIADGGPNRYDASGADSRFALTAFQGGSLMVRYNPMEQVDANWIADTLGDPSSVPPYALEASAFIVPAETDAVQPGWMWTGREHVFRSKNYGRNPLFFGPGEAGKEAHRANCNIWTGAFDDLNGNGVYDLPGDRCDDWDPLGDPGPDGRLTSPTYGDRAGSFVSVTQRSYSDANTLWAATGTGRIFISKNANDPNAAAVTFVRLDSLDPKAPPRYPTDIFVDRTNPNHAWITYSGYNSKTPATPGHVFEVFYHPPTSPGGAPQVVFTNRDGHKINGFGDIPANAIIQTNRGTLYVGTDYGVVVKEPNSTVWKMAPAGLPNIDVADLIYVPEKDALYAATHGQGVWELKVQ
jgi:hypothetical protein